MRGRVPVRRSSRPRRGGALLIGVSVGSGMISMKVEATGTASVRLMKLAVSGESDARFDAALAQASADQGGSPDTDRRDFSKMTRDGLFTWMNERIKAGELSLDDSVGLLGLSGGGAIGALSTDAAAPVDREPVDFFQLAQDRVAAARHRRESDVESIYLVALGVMQRFHAPS